MSTLFDKIVVVDLEATCWEGLPPSSEKNEIIEFGLCLLDLKTGEIENNQGLLVIPEKSTISDFCTRLTSISPEQVAAEGSSFSDCCARIRSEYKSKKRTWVSWGNYDQNKIKAECIEKKVNNPFGPNHINVKLLFSLMYKLPCTVGMPMALKILGMDLQGTHHRGKDDSFNIARILWAMIENKE